MSEVFQVLGEEVMPLVIDAVSNGECRILTFDVDEAIDDQGFPNPSFTPRTEYFIPCVWEVRSDNRYDA